MEVYFGGIEAGGKKFVCAVGSGPNNIRTLTQFPTTRPEETIGRVVVFLGTRKENTHCCPGDRILRTG
jgi:fructokinase